MGHYGRCRSRIRGISVCPFISFSVWEVLFRLFRVDVFLLPYSRSVHFSFLCVRCLSSLCVHFLINKNHHTTNTNNNKNTHSGLGAARFTVGALARIINLRHYNGELHFLPAAVTTDADADGGLAAKAGTAQGEKVSNSTAALAKMSVCVPGCAVCSTASARVTPYVCLSVCLFRCVCFFFI